MARNERRERELSTWTNARLRGAEPEEIAAAAPGKAEVRAVASRCAVFADPTRLQLLSVIRAASELCVSDLTLLTDVEGSVVSHHMRRARKAGLVKSRSVGKLAMYSLSRAGEEMLEAVMPE